MARVCDATEARVSVALRVKSCSCPRRIDCNHFYQACAWVKTGTLRSLSCSCEIAPFPDPRWMKSCSARSGILLAPRLDTDDVVRMRVAAKCWNDGRRNGKMGSIFFQLLQSDPFVKHWYNDAEGHTLCTSRYPNMERFHRVGLQEAEVFIPSHDFCTPESEDMSR